VLINGLAEQAESWYCNRGQWQRSFDVKSPEFLVYDGDVLQRRIREGLPISVDFLANQLEVYLDEFVQRPPYSLVASSLGGQIAVEYTVRHPDKVDRLVLLCPSGVGAEEKLPVVEGVRSNDVEAMIRSVFHSARFAEPGLVREYERLFANRLWRKGILRTLRGTNRHSIRDKLGQIQRPALVICGQDDRIVDPRETRRAVEGLPNFRFVLLPRCGHAPQIERPWLINRLVHDFLTGRRSGEPQPIGRPPRQARANV
jgi:pimeloyl-ACP methyl ester carboxylesterase